MSNKTFSSKTTKCTDFMSFYQNCKCKRKGIFFKSENYSKNKMEISILDFEKHKNNQSKTVLAAKQRKS